VISTSEALDILLGLVEPLGHETVSLIDGHGRVLASPVVATRAQPPFDASAMDGYAVNSDDLETGDVFKVIGEAAAGHGFDGSVGVGEAVRIFTGAPVPKGTKRVIIQEDAARKNNEISILDTLGSGSHIRPAGGDFDVGSQLSAPRILTPSNLALLASMNCPEIKVSRKPVIALIATGDELAMPGENPRDDQIIASNSFGLAALLTSAGADVRLLPIAKDTPSSLSTAFDLCEDVDLVITIGGASVGDHDIVEQVARDKGLKRAFYKVAMRPGKPLMAGKIGNSAMVGLPGNPVSSMVCAEIFILPMIDKMIGLGGGPRERSQGQLSHAIEANGPREHYMRAKCDGDGTVRVFDKQDSSLMTVLSDANALVVRAPHAEPAEIGSVVDIIRI
jgi:molybdopterin molybdotransferase